MPDFYQHRLITTIHDLGCRNPEEQKHLLKEHTRQRRVTLILPALFSEVTEPGLSLIIRELQEVDYIHHVVVSMNRMNEDEFIMARRFFLQLPQTHRIIWNDGPNLSGLRKRLEAAGIATPATGKGTNVWMAIGYALALGETDVIATHDTDILSYDQDMLLRICLPAVHPAVSYQFCKSYYGRVSDRMHGRVTRLLVMPLIRAMIEVLGPLPRLEYLDQFRYPLSGEFSMTTDLARKLKMPSHWGLEIGMLCGVFDNTMSDDVCQIDLGSNFDHKHQEIGLAGVSSRPNSGLTAMVNDIALTLFDRVQRDGVELDAISLKSIRNSYLKLATASIKRFHDDSVLNGLPYYQRNEQATILSFNSALAQADTAFMKEDFLPAEHPAWNHVLSVLPDFGEALVEAVEADYRRPL